MKRQYSKNSVLIFVFLGIYVTFQFFVLRLSHLLHDDDTTSVDGGSGGSGEKRKLGTGDNEDQANPPAIIIDLEAEIQKGLDYVKSIESTQRKLIFVHIPKTAGTTIEEVGGKQARVAWGSCLFNHKPKRRGGVCQYPPGQFEWPVKIGYWHLPTQLFPLKGINPYEDADLFAVVRDPNDRLLSEFLYICRKKISKWSDAIDCNNTLSNDPAYMNEWLQGKMKRPSSSSSTATTTTTSSTQLLFRPHDYLNLNGHFTPQYDFIMAHGNIRMVDYVLRMDHLQEEFAPLMQAYGVNAVMSSNKRNAARNTEDLEPKDFDETTRNRIQELYQRDFDLLMNRKTTS